MGEEQTRTGGDSLLSQSAETSLLFVLGGGMTSSLRVAATDAPGLDEAHLGLAFLASRVRRCSLTRVYGTLVLLADVQGISVGAEPNKALFSGVFFNSCKT